MSYDSRILAHLKRGKITPAAAYARYGCLALHSAVSRLREQGHRIVCTMKRKGTRHWGEYKLERRHG